MIRNGFRVLPADHPWPSMADPRTIGKWVGRGPRTVPGRHRSGGHPFNFLELKQATVTSRDFALVERPKVDYTG
jgi:hypothetical protein